MTSNIIRELLKATAFEPFTVHVADGTAIPVKHPECAVLTQGGRMFFVNTKDDDFEWADVFLITRVEASAQSEKF
jgi:hypothetical protein